jgi:hypothetical protein
VIFAYETKLNILKMEQITNLVPRAFFENAAREKALAPAGFQNHESWF